MKRFLSIVLVGSTFCFSAIANDNKGGLFIEPALI